MRFSHGKAGSGPAGIAGRFFEGSEMDSKYIPFVSLIPGKWYAIHCDPEIFSASPSLRMEDTVLLRCAVAGPFDSEILAADWFDQNPEHGGDHAHIRQVPEASP